ncbi:MAG: PorP/SprF family type IX secretion system membrane protein [Bacteroidetes bacterium]|nr:PorP/SprF family type IX secretion system membrane protein [Bacteroidota bacterium]MBP7400645.1 PorP/SprF family type IX secretion system membrane protein [Chitinophagales bacterium]MBK7110222.1 PorP/SprF family type IX secretion system membrane protein [Bacteroidota bacterium]MBP8755224.1 PorP/SprF family type IX secretion system membrane protein [Chitinophagales bacterium]MBP9190606.1 PorP/SprF family type IX secretion system membrane protein [Chitinophagales bacterium]
MQKKISYQFLLLSIFQCIAAISISQNLPTYEQYHFNQLVINPAYAGSNGTLDVQAFIHTQWTEMDGAPQTESLSASTVVGDGRHGIGISFVHDNVGVSDKIQLKADYAFRMYMGKGVLAIGISAIANYTNWNYAELDAFQDGDPAFTDVPETSLTPNSGFGIWYSNPIMFTGLSIPVLVENEDLAVIPNADETINVYDATRHYFYTLGFLIPISENFKLKPYTLAKYSFGSPVQIDGSLSMIFYDFLWVGGSYRTDKSITLMAEYFLKKNNTLRSNTFGFGYAYNFRNDNTSALFGATHEVFISFNLDTHITKFVNPRFF